MRARFDIIGFDPRGVGRSRPLHCFASHDEAERFFDTALVFPYLKSQEAPFTAFAARLGQLCLERGGAIIRHMSTANVARDMDSAPPGRRRRQALLRRDLVRLAASAAPTRPSSRTGSGRW